MSLEGIPRRKRIDSSKFLNPECILAKKINWVLDPDPDLPLASFNKKSKRCQYLRTESRLKELFTEVASLENNSYISKSDNRNSEIPKRFKLQILHDTLFWLSELQLPDLLTEETDYAYSKDYAERFLDLAFFLESYMRHENESGEIVPHKRKVEESSFYLKSEISIIHPFATLDIGLGVLDEMLKKNELKDSAMFKSLVVNKDILPISLILHDFTEDWDAMWGIESQDEAKSIILKKLINFFEDSPSKAFEALPILLCCDKNNTKNNTEYLDKIEASNEASFVKLCDIIQNTLSVHSENQKEKYEKYYVFFIHNFCEKLHSNCKLEDLLFDSLIRKMLESNPYLLTIFQSRRHLSNF